MHVYHTFYKLPYLMVMMALLIILSNNIPMIGGGKTKSTLNNNNNNNNNKQPHKKTTTKPTTLNKQTIVPKFPKLSEFFSKKPNIKLKAKLSQCDVTTKKEQCYYKTLPKKRHCLLFQNIIGDLVPYFRPFIAKTKLSSFQKHEVKEIQINTCTRKVTLTTFPQGNLTIYPGAMEVRNVEGAISLPIPFGDFQMLAGGEWKLKNLKMKVKFTRDKSDTYNVKGYSEKELVKVSDIGEAFDIDILPNGPIRILLQKIGIDRMEIRDCRLYGTMHPNKDIYELAFSGEPSKDEYAGGRLRVFITKNGPSRNLAVLLELQDYSPVTLLKSIYGPTIGRATVVHDRNQTIALYVSSQPTSKFSSILTAHGSGRWIHRDSNFDPGAYLLVTLPFPKRKAVDMKIKLHTDLLEFSLPENEKLYSDLALSAILPEKIMHLGVDRAATAKDKNNKIYSKIRILRFKYFVLNDTYLAAAESHLSAEEELSEYMPKAKQPLPISSTTALTQTKLKTNSLSTSSGVAIKSNVAINSNTNILSTALIDSNTVKSAALSTSKIKLTTALVESKTNQAAVINSRSKPQIPTGVGVGSKENLVNALGKIKPESNMAAISSDIKTNTATTAVISRKVKTDTTASTIGGNTNMIAALVDRKTDIAPATNLNTKSIKKSLDAFFATELLSAKLQKQKASASVSQDDDPLRNAEQAGLL